jgi:hypothetical protein
MSSTDCIACVMGNGHHHHAHRSADQILFSNRLLEAGVLIEYTCRQLLLNVV